MIRERVNIVEAHWIDGPCRCTDDQCFSILQFLLPSYSCSFHRANYYLHNTGHLATHAPRNLDWCSQPVPSPLLLLLLQMGRWTFQSSTKPPHKFSLQYSTCLSLLLFFLFFFSPRPPRSTQSQVFGRCIRRSDDRKFPKPSRKNKVRPRVQKGATRKYNNICWSIGLGVDEFSSLVSLAPYVTGSLARALIRKQHLLHPALIFGPPDVLHCMSVSLRAPLLLVHLK